jgi:3-deoxy-D-manno-octulosonic-acid transferase
MFFLKGAKIGKNVEMYRISYFWLMKMLYRILFWILPEVLKLSSSFSGKTRSFLAGREGLFEKLSRFRKNHPGKLVWFHVASLGEYEQARPVLTRWKEIHPDYWVAVSFFSPSGFDHVNKKNQPNVDFISYIPLDRKSWAEQFVEILKPELAFFVKYDLWFFHIKALKKQQIPVFLISAVFRENQVYFSRFGGFFRNILRDLDWIFTQNDESVTLANVLGINKVSKAGDTRFDRVAATAQSPKDLPDIQSWVGSFPTVVIGSAWDEDMEVLIPLINSKLGYRWIIAPHDLDPVPMEKWSKKINLGSNKYSSWQPGDTNSVLFIDNIGMLSSLYQFARFAYVGGAFGKGLHNILEPMGFGIPVIFGKVKNVGKFPEAAQSQKEGCGFEIATEKELLAVVEKLEQEDFYQNSAISAQNWVKSNLGAADRILESILSPSK